MEEVKVLGPQVGYVELLDHHTKLNMEKEKTDPKKKFAPLRPSSAGECTRALAFAQNEFLGNAEYEKENKSPETQRLLNLGHSVEWHVLRQFEDAFKDTDIKFRYKQQVVRFFKLPDGTYVEGSIDAVIVSPKFKCLIDVKSKKDKFSISHKTHWDEVTYSLKTNPHVVEFGVDSYYVDDLEAFLNDLNDPFWAMNFYQLNMYFFDEGDFLQGAGVDHAALIYYGKNDSRMREIRFKPSKAVYERVKAKFLLVAQYINEKRNPLEAPRDFALGSIKCAFCNFSKECWGQDVEALKEYFKTFPKKKWPTDLEKVPAVAELFKEYIDLEAQSPVLLTLEQEIVSILLSHKVNKIRVDKDHVYQIQHLKTGGPKNGPRIVLRRSKD
jgi:hypothetical protein